MNRYKLLTLLTVFSLLSVGVFAADRAKVTLTEPNGTVRNFTEDAVVVNPPPPPVNTVPNGPTGLKIVNPTRDSLTLQWVDNATNETSFEVSASTDGTNFSTAASIGADSTSWTSASLHAATQYWYRVRAVNDVGPSGWSVVATGSTGNTDPIPPPPIGSVEGGTGVPTPVPADAKVMQAGTDIGTLTGSVALKTGTYSFSGKLKKGLRLYCADGIHTVTISQRAGGQITGDTDIQLYGVVFTGGATGTHNDQAAVITNGWYLEDVTVEHSTGCGISINGTGNKSIRLIADSNDASGRGFKCKGDGKTEGSGYTEIDSIIRNNNSVDRDGDGANKATRSDGILLQNMWCYGNTGRGIWFDFKNSKIVIRGGAIHDMLTKTTSDYSYGGGCFYEYDGGVGGPGGLIVDGVTFWNNDGISMSVGESWDVEVMNCVFKLGNPKSNYRLWGIGFRNIVRGSEKNILKNIRIHDNRFEDGTGIYSNGGISLSGNQIVIGTNDWVSGGPRISVPASVVLKSAKLLKAGEVMDGPLPTDNWWTGKDENK